MRLPLPIATYRLPEPAASCARLANCFAEQAHKSSSKGAFYLHRSPGIASFADLGDSPVRGMAKLGATVYALSGSTLYSVDSAGNETALSGTIPGLERVRMASNGTNLVIVRPGDNTAYTTTGGAVSQITDSTFTGWGASDVGFIDGYLVFTRPNTQQFFNSGLNALTFSGLDIASAEGAPDNVWSLLVDHRELFLGGEETCELWFDAAAPTGSPFARSPNGVLEIGMGAAYSAAKQDNSLFFLANDRTYRRLQGVSPQRVSQHGIEAAWQRMSVIDDCFALPYRQEGHEFIALQFPNASRTFVFDATTKEWHERASLGYGRWRPNCVLGAYGKQLVGDSQSGKIGYLDPETFDEWGDPQQMSWTHQSVYTDRRRSSHRRLELVVNSGAGLTTGQGSNPLVTLKVSDDGGNTFRARPTRSMGEIGHYKQRLFWMNLGSSRDRVYQFDVTDPVPVIAVDVQIEGEGLRL